MKYDAKKAKDKTGKLYQMLKFGKLGSIAHTGMKIFSYLCNVKILCGTITASSYEGAIVVSNLIGYKVILYKDYCAVSRDR